MKVKKKTRVICGIIFVAVLVTALFINNKLFDGKLTCTGIITDHIGEWEYDSDCFIVEESKYGISMIVYESLEEINNKFHKNTLRIKAEGVYFHTSQFLLYSIFSFLSIENPPLF